MKKPYGFLYNIAACILYGLSSLLFSCCTGDGPEPPCLPVERTVLVYMVASNSLGTGGYDMADLAEMERAAENGDIHDGRLVVYHVPVKGDAVLKEITHRGVDTLKVYDGDACSVQSGRMEEVIADCKRLAPAENYGLVLWSHADGWLQDGIDEADSESKTYAFGLDRGKKMNVTTLASVLDGKDFDFVYFDCCYMGAVEVAYELRNVTGHIVASASELIVTGMPYDKNVECFFSDPPDLVKAASNTFDYYNSQSDDFYRTCTMSVVSTAGMGRLADITRELYRSATLELPDGHIPQRFMTGSRCYHYDLKDYVHAIAPSGDLLMEWDKALNDVVVYSAATARLWNELPINAHCGLSTYIMKSEQDALTKGYNTTSWFVDVASQLIR